MKGGEPLLGLWKSALFGLYKSLRQNAIGGWSGDEEEDGIVHSRKV